MDGNNDNGLPEPVKAPKYLSHLSAVSALLQAQHAAIESATKPYRDVVRLQKELSRSVFAPITAAVRAQQEIASTLTRSSSAILDAQVQISRSLTRSLIEPISSVLAAQQEISGSIFARIADVSEITKRVAEISDRKSVV
jgi:hypothetical protein